MPAEYRYIDGTLRQGYYCMRCGETTNMYGTGHGPTKCVSNYKLVKALKEANKPRFEYLIKSRWERGEWTYKIMTETQAADYKRKYGYAESVTKTSSKPVD